MIKRSGNRYQVAKVAWNRGKHRQAEKILKEILATNRGHLKASRLLGKLYLSNNQPELAEAVTLSALQRHPEDPELVINFSRSLLGQGRLGEATDYLSRSKHADSPDHLGLLAALHQRQGKHAAASEYYQQALALKPDQVTWLAGLGISQEHLENREAAKDAYQRSLASASLSPTLKNFVAGRLKELRKY